MCIGEMIGVQPVGSVKLSLLVVDAVAGHAASASPQEASGLLIGSQAFGASEVSVSRALRSMTAPAPEPGSSLVDPRAVANVRRSLEGSPLSIVGFYRSQVGGDGSPSVSDWTVMGSWPGMAWLTVSPDGDGAFRALRAWWLDEASEAPRELAIHAAAPAGPLGCPD